MPRVSVIVPNFNHASFLKQRMDTVLGQTYSDLEVIFLDDASSDASCDVFEQFASDPRIKAVFNKENSGSPFKQWNRGLELATGDYIWIAETDDYAELELLEVLVSVLDSNPDVGLAYCQSCMVRRDNTQEEISLIDSWYMSFDDHSRWQNDYKNSGRDELTHYMAYKNSIPNASAVVFRRSALGSCIRAPEDMRLAGDWMFWTQILCNSNVAFVAKPLNYFRSAHSGSQRSKTASRGLLMIEGLEVYEFIRENCVLDASIRASALKEHLRLWARLAFNHRLAWNANKAIYEKILSVHPEASVRKWRAVLLPFCFYFVAVPLKRIPPLLFVVRGIKQFSQFGTRIFKRARQSH